MSKKSTSLNDSVRSSFCGDLSTCFCGEMGFGAVADAWAMTPELVSAELPRSLISFLS